MLDFETALAFIAGVFLLLGIVGRVEVQNLRLGTDNPISRATTIAVGLILLLIALGQKTELFAWVRTQTSLSSTEEKPVATRPEPRPLGYFVVVSSTRLEGEAVRRAERLTERGYSAEVHRSSTGYLAVAVRAQSEAHSSQIYSTLLVKGLAREDAFLSVGERFIEQVYP